MVTESGQMVKNLEYFKTKRYGHIFTKTGYILNGMEARLTHLTTLGSYTIFPITDSLAAGDQVVGNCVNSGDPSTINNGYLQPKNSNGAIPCNGKPIANNTLIGTYIGGDRVKTFQYARIINERLRINFHREGTELNPNQLGMGLIQPTINGENGSIMNFPLNYLEVTSCFWGEEPKPATPVVTAPACASGPTLANVTNISKTGLRFTFSGTSIPNVKWRIKLNNSEVRSGTSGQLSNATTVNIVYGSLSAGNYLLEIEGGDCTSSVSSQSFTITEPAAPACVGGPSITSVANIGSTSLKVNFSGTNIATIAWKIKSGSTELATGTTATSANSATLTFNNIVNGTYSLEIQGSSCTSGVSSQNFTIAANCDRGPSLQGISSVTDVGLSFLLMETEYTVSTGKLCREVI